MTSGATTLALLWKCTYPYYSTHPYNGRYPYHGNGKETHYRSDDLDS